MGEWEGERGQPVVVQGCWTEHPCDAGTWNTQAEQVALSRRTGAQESRPRLVARLDMCCCDERPQYRCGVAQSALGPRRTTGLGPSAHISHIDTLPVALSTTTAVPASRNTSLVRHPVVLHSVNRSAGPPSSSRHAHSAHLSSITAPRPPGDPAPSSTLPVNSVVGDVKMARTTSHASTPATK